MAKKRRKRRGVPPPPRPAGQVCARPGCGRWVSDGTGEPLTLIETRHAEKTSLGKWSDRPFHGDTATRLTYCSVGCRDQAAEAMRLELKAAGAPDPVELSYVLKCDNPDCEGVSSGSDDRIALVPAHSAAEVAEISAFARKHGYPEWPGPAGSGNYWMVLCGESCAADLHGINSLQEALRWTCTQEDMLREALASTGNRWRFAKGLDGAASYWGDDFPEPSHIGSQLLQQLRGGDSTSPAA